MKNDYDSHTGLTRRELMKYGIYAGLGAGVTSNFLFNGCSRKRRPNVILITLDTTRADHMSCYGYHRQTSPNLDKLADDSVLYTNAIAPSSWTLPSHASLFTGKFTSSHGARFHPEGWFVLSDAITRLEEWNRIRARGLARDELTLAGILRKEGYATGGIAGGPWLKKVFGLNKGFDYYDDRGISTDNGRLAGEVTDSALKWLEKTRDKEFFLFLNYFDPHFPYKPHEGFSSSFLPLSNAIDLSQGRRPTRDKLIGLYDGEILYMDHHIGKLLQKLKADNLYEKTMIIVTADHGELLGEHGKFFHGHNLYQEVIHVPLLIKYPGTETSPNRTDAYIQLNDIMAIVLDRLRITMPQGIQAGVPPKIGHPLLSETYPLTNMVPGGHWRAILDGSYKFIWNSKGNHQLFNMKDDSGEESNLAAAEPEIMERMMSNLDRYMASLPKPGPAPVTQELDEKTKEALRSLGYVG